MNTLILFALFSKATLSVSSSAFIVNGNIPPQYTCSGRNVNPPLTIGNIPKEAKSLAIIVEDPDAVNGTFDHWVTWNIAPTAVITENSSPGIDGKNGKQMLGYTGPCPPNGRHRYFFKVYALDTMLDLKTGTGKQALIKAMKGHVLAEGELIGLYEKQTAEK